MNQDLEGLEQEVEGQFEAMSLELDVDPPPAVVTRVRAEVRHALNETWLKAQPQPLPDAAALARVAAAVRQELGRKRLVAPRQWLMVGATAAAATLLIFGLRGLGPTQDLTGGLALLAGDEVAIEQFVQVADRVWAEDPLTREIRDDLEIIEEGLTQFSIADDTMEPNMGDLDSRLNVPEQTHDRVDDWLTGAMG